MSTQAPVKAEPQIIETSTVGAVVSNVDLGLRKATVVFEYPTQDELYLPEIRHRAIQYAQSKGLIGAAIRREGHVYPVGQDGRPADPTQAMPKTGKFRIDIELGSTL